MSTLKAKQHPDGLLERYDRGGFYCEITGADGQTAPHTAAIRQWLNRTRLQMLRRRARDCERELFNLGITFTVYSDRDAIDRILPFDVIPRAIAPAEWRTLERGLVQRVTALNQFLRDIYSADASSRTASCRRSWSRAMITTGRKWPTSTSLTTAIVNICGVDLVRDGEGDFCVLEDNARTPSGVSYVIENRHLMQRAFPDMMECVGIRSVSNYGMRLRRCAGRDRAEGSAEPAGRAAVARRLQLRLFRARLPRPRDGRAAGRGTRPRRRRRPGLHEDHPAGCRRVDVIYRRIDDDFIDPEAFNRTACSACPASWSLPQGATSSLANAVGTGVADDKAVYAYVPRIIKYYLDRGCDPAQRRDPYLPREGRAAVHARHLHELVVKPVGESGGYGVVVGPRSSAAELEDCRAQLMADPANFISQPMVQLSVCPTLVDRAASSPGMWTCARSLITGRSTWVLPGGLTRVALKKGSLIVNSSQGRRIEGYLGP